MSATTNPKSAAWDHVGRMFWELGRPSARPDAETIERFLDGVVPGSPVLVVGASTRDLVAAAVERGAEVTVADFSRRMCDDLAAAVGDAPVRIRHADITGDWRALGERSFSVVLSDRLVNRFTRDELRRALASMAALATPGGEVRATVKYGFYPMDLRLIEQGRAAGTLQRFYDESTRTLDYSAAGDLLEAALVPHGDIPRPVLLAWYRGRGTESRYEPGDIAAVAAEVAGLALVSEAQVGANEDCIMCVFRVGP